MSRKVISVIILFVIISCSIGCIGSLVEEIVIGYGHFFNQYMQHYGYTLHQFMEIISHITKYYILENEWPQFSQDLIKVIDEDSLSLLMSRFDLFTLTDKKDNLLINFVCKPIGNDTTKIYNLRGRIFLESPPLIENDTLRTDGYIELLEGKLIIKSRSGSVRYRDDVSKYLFTFSKDSSEAGRFKIKNSYFLGAQKKHSSN